MGRMDTENPQLCQGKRCMSFREAHQLINDVKSRNQRNHSKKIPKRVYRCPMCGTYHVTSQQLTDKPWTNGRHCITIMPRGKK
ncbi:hypothetical protein CCP3SC15_5040001 [Gammaproteobacteria bacterium]